MPNRRGQPMIEILKCVAFRLADTILRPKHEESFPRLHWKSADKGIRIQYFGTAPGAPFWIEDIAVEQKLFWSFLIVGKGLVEEPWAPSVPWLWIFFEPQIQRLILTPRTSAFTAARNQSEVPLRMRDKTEKQDSCISHAWRCDARATNQFGYWNLFPKFLYAGGTANSDP